MDRYLDLFSVLEIKKKDFAPCRERTSKPSVRPSGDFQRHFVLYFPIELKARQFVVRQVIKWTLWLILFAFFFIWLNSFRRLVIIIIIIICYYCLFVWLALGVALLFASSALSAGSSSDVMVVSMVQSADLVGHFLAPRLAEARSIRRCCFLMPFGGPTRNDY